MRKSGGSRTFGLGHECAIAFIMKTKYRANKAWVRLIVKTNITTGRLIRPFRYEIKESNNIKNQNDPKKTAAKGILSTDQYKSGRATGEKSSIAAALPDSTREARNNQAGM
jgi:hypothetical protein